MLGRDFNKISRLKKLSMNTHQFYLRIPHKTYENLRC